MLLVKEEAYGVEQVKREVLQATFEAAKKKFEDCEASENEKTEELRLERENLEEKRKVAVEEEKKQNQFLNLVEAANRSKAPEANSARAFAEGELKKAGVGM